MEVSGTEISGYSFGPFRLDLVRRLLISGSRVKSVPENLFRILSELIEAGGNVVSRERLFDAVWPDVEIGDANLTQHVYLLRKLLEAMGGKGTYVAAASKRGYRLTVPARAIPASVELTPRVAAALGRSLASGDLEAFRYYCEACYELERRTQSSLLSAIERFEKAIGLYPTYSQAHLGLAKAYTYLGGYLYALGRDVFPKAKRAALSALELTPTAACYAQLGDIAIFGEWDLAGAASSLETAVALEPDSAFVHGHMTWLAIACGDYDRALYEAKLALALDSASLFYRNLLGRVLVHRGQYGEAIEVLESLIRTDPAFAVAMENLTLAYLVGGEPLAAVKILERVRELDRIDSHGLGHLALAYADLGDRGKTREIYETLLRRAAAEYVPRWPVALAAIGLGDEPGALRELETAFDEREASLIFLARLPLFATIAEKPAYKRIAAEVYRGFDTH